jgi:hypothetical protein
MFMLSMPRLTIGSTGGREANFTWFLSVLRAAPVNPALYARVRDRLDVRTPPRLQVCNHIQWGAAPDLTHKQGESMLRARLKGAEAWRQRRDV